MGSKKVAAGKRTIRWSFFSVKNEEKDTKSDFFSLLVTRVD